MSEVTLTAETGREIGTAPSRRLRAEGRVPGVVYGPGQPATAITIDRKELRRALNTEAGSNALVTLTVGDDSMVVILREVQRHPVRRDVTHVDFFKVDPTRPIDVDVPVHLTGEPKKVTTMGGITEQRINTIKVRVRPDGIPDSITVDISDMTLDRSILVKDVAMPEGCTAISNPQQAVVTAELTRAAITAARAGGAEAAD